MGYKGCKRTVIVPEVSPSPVRAASNSVVLVLKRVAAFPLDRANPFLYSANSYPGRHTCEDHFRDPDWMK